MGIHKLKLLALLLLGALGAWGQSTQVDYRTQIKNTPFIAIDPMATLHWYAAITTLPGPASPALNPGFACYAADGTMGILNFTSSSVNGSLTTMTPAGKIIWTSPSQFFPNACLWVPSVTQSPGQWWISNYNSNTVTILNADGTLATTVNVGVNPNGMAFNGTNVLVTNQGDGTITLVNPTTYVPVGAAISVGGSTFQPLVAAVDKNGNWWIGCVSGGTPSGSLIVMSPSGTILNTYHTGTGAVGWLTTDGDAVFVVLFGGVNLLEKWSVDTGAVVCQATVGSNTQGVQVIGTSVFSTSFISNLVYENKVSNCASIRTYAVTGPSSIASDGIRAWVPSALGQNIVVIQPPIPPQNDYATTGTAGQFQTGDGTGRAGTPVTLPALATSGIFTAPGSSAPAVSGTTPAAGTATCMFNAINNGIMCFGINGTAFSWVQITNAGNLATNYPLYLNPNGGIIFSGPGGWGMGTDTVVASLPACNSGSVYTDLAVRDSNTKVPGATAAGGGQVHIHVECINDAAGTGFNWVIR